MPQLFSSYSTGERNIIFTAFPLNHKMLEASQQRPRSRPEADQEQASSRPGAVQEHARSRPGMPAASSGASPQESPTTTTTTERHRERHCEAQRGTTTRDEDKFAAMDSIKKERSVIRKECVLKRGM